MMGRILALKNCASSVSDCDVRTADLIPEQLQSSPSVIRTLVAVLDFLIWCAIQRNKVRKAQILPYGSSGACLMIRAGASFSQKKLIQTWIYRRNARLARSPAASC